MFCTSSTKGLLTISPIEVKKPSNSANYEYRDPNPPVSHASPSVPAIDRLYVLIMDSEYRPTPLLCKQREIWIEKLLKLPFVDNVEVYSNVSFEICNISTVAYENAPEKYHIRKHSQCYTLLNGTWRYMQRSNAGWLMVVSDYAYVNVDNLVGFMKELQQNRIRFFMRGQVTEPRDYFQYFADGSGGVFRRELIQSLHEKIKHFDIACQADLGAFEAFSHGIDPLQMYAVHNHDTRWLSNAFHSMKVYQKLKSGNFSSFRKCPKSYHSPRVPHPTVNRLSDLIVWASPYYEEGSVGIPLENKLSFLDLAVDLPSFPHNLSYIYDIYRAIPCITDNHP